MMPKAKTATLVSAPPEKQVEELQRTALLGPVLQLLDSAEVNVGKGRCDPSR